MGTYGVPDLEYCAAATGRTPVQRSWFTSLAIFALVLVVLDRFFGWGISIVGSVVLTIILSVILNAVSRR